MISALTRPVLSVAEFVRNLILLDPTGSLTSFATALRLLLIISAALAIGCSTDSKNGIVSGTVTLDGQPLESGLIRFLPVDGQTSTADAPIIGGSFTATMPIGDKRVSIFSPKVVGQRRSYDTADSPMVDMIQESLPAKYNSQSTLTLTVKPGRQEQPYDLTSK